jgi:hypothetical protein
MARAGAKRKHMTPSLGPDQLAEMRRAE